MAVQGVQVEGLGALVRTFRVMPVEISEELVWELEETADPVRKKSTEFILSGGGGYPGMRNMPPTPVYAAMRVGVSRAETAVYVAPAWRSRGAGRARPNVAREFRDRMEAALEAERGHIIERVDDMIDRVADRHGF